LQVVLVLFAGLTAVAQDGVPQRLSGTISDYTQAANVGGPWEVRGHWSLHVHDDSGTADFSAALAMVHSDLGVILSTNPNLNDPKARNAHTHHIFLVGGAVSAIPNGFRISGTATITGNGSFPPPFGPTSTLQVDITGGNTVTFSNIALTFGGQAVGHFGSNAISGVIVRSKDHKRRGDD
jgi:hypothetical protein